jgi:hypothetical protein
LPWVARQAAPPKRIGIAVTVFLSSDNDPDFTDEFCDFLRRCVANVDAAEFLRTLAKNPDRSWGVDELRAELAPDSTINDADAQRCVDALLECDLVTREVDNRFRYRPSSAHDAHVAVLTRLYLERPVTLFRAIYALRHSQINTLADAPKLRE